MREQLQQMLACGQDGALLRFSLGLDYLKVGEAFAQGIALARTRGDKQAERKMRVFARRLNKARDAHDAHDAHDKDETPA